MVKKIIIGKAGAVIIAHRPQCSAHFSCAETSNIGQEINIVEVNIFFQKIKVNKQ